MDRFLEQKLRDEVRYLHSLWHQGPPISNPSPYMTNNPIIPIYNPNPKPNIIPIFNPNHNPNPNFNPYPYVSRHLQPSKPTQFKNEKQLKPSNSTPFKKEKKRRSDKRGGINRGKHWAPGSDPRPVSDFEWPCDPDLPDTCCGWPTLDFKPGPTTHVSTEEESRIFATRLQQQALKATQKLFGSNMDRDGNDNDEYGEVDDDDDDDDDDIMDEDGGDEYKFFLKVFMEDSELRRIMRVGNFVVWCVVGLDRKWGKGLRTVLRFQHSVTIAKTKKRQAHRAFGQAICKALGWDIDKLPNVVLPKLGDSQGNAPDVPDHAFFDGSRWQQKYGGS